jgi:hypothetical protein
MVLRHVWFAAIGAAALAWSGLSAAQQYRPDEFLKLDLPSAVLSPKPLGPAATFAPGPLDVTIEHPSNAAQANAEPAAEPEAEPASGNKTALRAATYGHRVVHGRAADQPTHKPPRTAVALHRRNPVDAQASDARVQVWPCKSGGICNWKR